MMFKLLFLFFVNFPINAAFVIQYEITTIFNSQNCTNRCTDCGITAIFINEKCSCLVRNDDIRALACLNGSNIDKNSAFKRATFEFLNPDTINRRIRSASKFRRKIQSNDVKRIVNYFISDGPMTGTPFIGKAKCTSNEASSAEKPDESESEPTKSKKLSPEKDRSSVARKKELSGVVNEDDKSRIKPFYSQDLLGALPNTLLQIPDMLLHNIIDRQIALYYYLLSRTSLPWLDPTSTRFPINQNYNPFFPYIPVNDQNPVSTSKTRARVNQLDPRYYYETSAEPYVSDMFPPQYLPLPRFIESYENEPISPPRETSGTLKITKALPNDENEPILLVANDQQRALFGSPYYRMSNSLPAGVLSNHRYMPIPYLLEMSKPVQKCNCGNDSSSRETMSEATVNESSKPSETTTLRTTITTTVLKEATVSLTKSNDESREITNSEKSKNSDNRNGSNDENTESRHDDDSPRPSRHSPNEKIKCEWRYILKNIYASNENN